MNNSGTLTVVRIFEDLVNTGGIIRIGDMRFMIGWKRKRLMVSKESLHVMCCMNGVKILLTLEKKIQEKR